MWAMSFLPAAAFAETSVVVADGLGCNLASPPQAVDAMPSGYCSRSYCCGRDNRLYPSISSSKASCGNVGLSLPQDSGSIQAAALVLPCSKTPAGDGVSAMCNPSCTPENSSCNSSPECCSGFSCLGKKCVVPPACKTQNVSCTKSSDCCDGLSCSGSKCKLADNCVSASGSCSSNGDCCSGLTCQGGKCNSLSCAYTGQSNDSGETCDCVSTCKSGFRENITKPSGINCARACASACDDGGCATDSSTSTSGTTTGGSCFYTGASHDGGATCNCTNSCDSGFASNMSKPSGTNCSTACKNNCTESGCNTPNPTTSSSSSSSSSTTGSCIGNGRPSGITNVHHNGAARQCCSNYDCHGVCQPLGISCMPINPTTSTSSTSTTTTSTSTSGGTNTSSSTSGGSSSSSGSMGCSGSFSAGVCACCNAAQTSCGSFQGSSNVPSLSECTNFCAQFICP